MDTHGLPPAGRGAPTDASPLPEGALALRASLRERRILAVTPELAALIGDDSGAIVGRPMASLWAVEERDAIRARFDGVVLLGSDAFGAVALQSAGPGSTLVEVEARYARDGGERIDAILWPVRDLSGAPVPGLSETQRLAAVVSMADASGDPTATTSSPESSSAADGPDGDVARAALAAAGGIAPDVVLAVLDAAGCTALLVDGSGEISGATSDVGRLFSVAAAALEGQPLEAAFAFPGPAADALATARSAGERQSVRAEPEGSSRSLLLEWVPMGDGGAGAALLTATDGDAEDADTERLRFQAQLVSHVAHDLRDASASVYAGLRTLVDELAADSDAHETASEALVESRRVHRIIDEVLAVTRPGRLRRVDIDLNAILEETLGRFRTRAVDLGVELETSLGPAAVVSADRSSLERAFGNLVENAFQEMRDGGRLIVSTEREARVGDGVLATIADTGGGIDPEMQGRVFEPFVTGKEDGSGLGLAITRRVVLDHGGQIDFETEVGQGTKFRVWLPCSA